MPNKTFRDYPSDYEFEQVVKKLLNMLKGK